MFKLAAAFAAATALLVTGSVQAQTRPTRSLSAPSTRSGGDNTTASVGDCTLAAQKMAAHLKSAGFPDKDLTIFFKPDLPKNGGLVAVYPGTDPKRRPSCCSPHRRGRGQARGLDARSLHPGRRGGYFYGRGASDDKAQASIWVDT